VDETKDTAQVQVKLSLAQAAWLAEEFDASYARYVDGGVEHPVAVAMYESISEAIHTAIEEAAS
jgi:hypothetical protein